MLEILNKLFEYYLANQNDLVEKYNGKVVVIKDNQVIGAYDSEIAAFVATSKEHQPGSFIIQRVTPGQNAYTVNVASNLVVLSV